MVGNNQHSYTRYSNYRPTGNFNSIRSQLHKKATSRKAGKNK